jgi:hypothetical protein
MSRLDAELPELLLNDPTQNGDRWRGVAWQRRRFAETGQIKRQDVVARRQGRQDRIPDPPRGTEPMEQHQRLPASGALDGQSA